MAIEHRTERVVVLLTPTERDQLREWRHRHHIGSQGEAIREMMRRVMAEEGGPPGVVPKREAKRNGAED